MNCFNGCGNSGFGCGNGCDACSLLVWIIILQSLCGCGCQNNGCNIDCCTLIILMLLCGCGCNSSCK